MYVAAFEEVGAGRPLHWIYARTARSDEEGYVPSTYLVRVTREAVEIETVRARVGAHRKRVGTQRKQARPRVPINTGLVC